MKIYDFAASPNARKVRSVAYELGLTPEWVVVNIFKGENRSPLNSSGTERVGVIAPGPRSRNRRR